MKAKCRILILALCILMLSSVTVTLAYMVDQDVQVNTFAAGNIEIDLDEEAGTPDDNSPPDQIIREFEMVEPGEIIPKDPVITVRAGSEDCWLFVKLTVSENFDHYLTYALADGWVALGDDYPGVYYYSHYIPGEEIDQQFQVLEGDEDHPDGKVTVKADITGDDLRGLARTDGPALEITAYAIQYAGFEESPEAAWRAFVGEEAAP